MTENGLGLGFGEELTTKEQEGALQVVEMSPVFIMVVVT